MVWRRDSSWLCNWDTLANVVRAKFSLSEGTFNLLYDLLLISSGSLNELWHALTLSIISVRKWSMSFKMLMKSGLTFIMGENSLNWFLRVSIFELTRGSSCEWVVGVVGSWVNRFPIDLTFLMVLTLHKYSLRVYRISGRGLWCISKFIQLIIGQEIKSMSRLLIFLKNRSSWTIVQKWWEI